MKILMIVPCDLSRNCEGKIIIGPETRIACDEALRLCHNDTSYRVIIATAGIAGPEWNYIWFSQVIETYIKATNESLAKFIKPPTPTSKFNTSGEMEELAKLLWKNNLVNPEITLVVKWWHAPRAKFLCKYWLRKKGVKAKVLVHKCHSTASKNAIFGEFIGAWPKNLLKMALGKL